MISRHTAWVVKTKYLHSFAWETLTR